MRYFSTIIFLVVLAANTSFGEGKESGAVLANFKGNRPSPIKLNLKETPTEAVIIRNDYGQNETGILMNTAKSLEVILDETATDQFITGEPLGNYFFIYAKTIFHWAKEATGVAGTKIGDKGAPLEISVIHYNSKYRSLADALDDNDGVADLRFLVSVIDDEDNDAIKPFLEKLKEVYKPGNTSINMSKHNSWYLEFESSKYYAYGGQYENKNCAIVVICETFLNISRNQFEDFLKIKSNDGEELDTAQETHEPEGRPIVHSKEETLVRFDLPGELFPYVLY